MCRELVARAVEDERILKRLAIPQRFWNYIAASWKRGDGSLYGRFDLRYDGTAPPSFWNTMPIRPTSVFETAVFQWSGSRTRTPGRSSRAMPTSSIRCMTG